MPWVCINYLKVILDLIESFITTALLSYKVLLCKFVKSQHTYTIFQSYVKLINLHDDISYDSFYL